MRFNFAPVSASISGNGAVFQLSMVVGSDALGELGRAASTVSEGWPIARLATDENIGISIETLLKDGWQVAGYAAANQCAVESAMILLRHADQSYLVQCRKAST